MERVILLQNQHWIGKKYEKLFNREILQNLIEKISLPHIQALTGVRRCGKSTLFRLLINYLTENQTEPNKILFLNLDDPVFQESWKNSANLYHIIETAEKVSGQKADYLFLDEVQSVAGWEHFVKSIYDNRLYKKIFVTGSNSSLLTGNYATALSGRYITDMVYPYSFAEILKNNQINNTLELLNSRPAVLRIIEKCMQSGFYPEIQNIETFEMQRQVLLSYFETITMKDCIIQHSLRDNRLFRELTLYIFNTIATVYSYHSLSKSVNTNENTVKSYINALTDSYIITEIQNFSFSPKANARPKNKAYCIDNGILSSVANFYSPNQGRLFENMVFCELQKLGCTNIHFYTDDNECDFIIRLQSELIAIQVVYELTNTNRQREIKGLEIVKQKFGINRLYIITMHQIATENEIQILPFWKIQELFIK